MQAILLNMMLNRSSCSFFLLVSDKRLDYGWNKNTQKLLQETQLVFQEKEMTHFRMKHMEVTDDSSVNMDENPYCWELEDLGKYKINKNSAKSKFWGPAWSKSMASIVGKWNKLQILQLFNNLYHHHCIWLGIAQSYISSLLGGKESCCTRWINYQKWNGTFKTFKKDANAEAILLKKVLFKLI